MSEQPRHEDEQTGLPAAGWFVDPERPGMLRWWDGAKWTEHRVADPEAAARSPTPKPWRPERPQRPRPTETSGWAIASLVLGVLALTPGAIACGVIAKRRIAASNGKVGGDAMATAGIALGVVYSVLLAAVAVETFVPQDNEPNFTGPEKPVAGLVDSVGRAISGDEGRRACATLFTPVFARRVARGSGQDCPSFVAEAVGDGDFQAHLKVTSIEIAGQTAKVEVTEGSDHQVWSLDRIADRWRVDDISA